MKRFLLAVLAVFFLNGVGFAADSTTIKIGGIFDLTGFRLRREMVVSMAFDDWRRLEEATAEAIAWMSSRGADRELDGALLSVLARSTTSQCSARGLRV